MESQEVTKIYITYNSLLESKGMDDLSLDLVTSYSMCEVRTSNLGIKYGFVFFFLAYFTWFSDARVPRSHPSRLMVHRTF